MKQLFKFTLLFIALICATGSFAQVGLTATLGTPTGSYTNLKGAFEAINLGTHKGVIVITITGTSTETASAILNASGSGSANYSGITINPSGAAVITGAVSGHLIDLNGANYVTINGLNTGANTLTITNTGTSSASVIRFTADASNNTITNCTLQGSSTIFGVVYFGIGLTTGNNSNTVSYCNIGPAGSNNPLNGIYSMGATSIINSGNTISNNNIFDYFNASLSCSGMNINSYNSAWTITNNKLYQTTNRTYSSASSHYGINITSGSGYTITGNIIGYANAAGTGTTNMIGLTSGALTGTFPSSYSVGGVVNATKYVAINCNFAVGGTMSSIQNNTIAGFALYTGSSTSGTVGVFCGIAVSGGNANIGTTAGNLIGTASSSIYIATTISAGAIAGIYSTSTNTVTIQNNVLQNLDAMGTSATTAGSINGINTEGSGTFVVSGNTIGGTSNPSLRTGNLTTGGNLSNVGTTFTTASGTSLFQGIRNAASGTVTIGTQSAPNTIRNIAVNSTGSLALYRGIYVSAGTTNVSYNTISNITSVSTSATYGSAGLSGIGILMVSAVNGVISNNTINGLSITNTGTAAYPVAGIVYNTPVTSITVSKNKVYGISNAGTSTSVTAPATATGIFIRDGAGAATTIDNNMISLGNGETSNTAFVGIWAQYLTSVATTMKIYFNTVNIEGTVTSGAQPSMCIQRGDFSTSAATTFTIDAKNNILNNTRSGGTGKHYAIANNYGATATSATGWAANASDYNVLNANAATIGYWTGDQTYSNWETVSSCDNNSLSGETTTFTNTATGNLHMNMSTTMTKIESGGVAITGYTTDFDGDARPGPLGSVNGGGTKPDIGADEFDGVPFSTNKTLNLTFFLEGLYNGGGTMLQAMDDMGAHFGAGIADQVKVELHDATTYATIVYTANNVNLTTAGAATVTVPGTFSGSYYVTIRHRNSIQTVSAAPVSFATGTISYDFSTAASQAYGDNMKLMTDKFVFYGGDVNQDDIVDSSDMMGVDNLSAGSATGYIPEDVNGDGLVDSTDMAVLDNNSSASISAAYPM